MRGVAGFVGLDLLLAVALTVAGEVELLLGSGDAVSAVALPLTTLPLAWRRRAPLLPLAAIALVLPVQALLDGELVGDAVTPLVALVVALYSAGRHADRLPAALSLVAALVATRVAFDPAVRDAADALVTLVYVPLPLLVGRWVRGQALLQDELREKTEQLDRERERNARHAAEEERMRIASDLQVAVSDALATIVRQAGEVAGGAGGEAARSRLADCAERAREALADVRRILGVLRRSGSRAPRAPVLEGRPAAHESSPGAHAAADEPSWAGPVPTDTPPPDVVPPADRRPSRLDRWLVAALFVGAAIELAILDDRLVAIPTAALIAAPLLWRRSRPVEVALAVLAAIALQHTLLGLDRFPIFDMAAITCAAYAIGAHSERDRAVVGLVLLALGSAAHSAVFHPDAIAAAVLGGVLAPWTAGRTIRSRRQLTRELREKTVRLSRARAREARAAALDERIRVARELHDAVAHNLSVIAIQAAGADGLVDRDPARAAETATLIAAVGREALAELDRLVAPASAGAEPSLAHVDRLAARARDAGLPVELHVEGEPAALPTGVDLAAYRIVQEALANTSKHAGDAHARVTVRYEPRAVEVEVADDGRGANGHSGDGSGHGLVGIRERVALYGGTLALGGGERGGFTVRARLPIGRV